jgi:nitrite reductase (NADH) large subunit
MDRARPPSRIPGPLAGATIALPATNEADALAELLARGGALVRRVAGAPGPATDEHAIGRWLTALVEGEFDDVVFFSAQGVRIVCEIARQLGRETSVVEALRRTRLVAHGRRTGSALSEFGLAAQVLSTAEDPLELLKAMSGLELAGRVVALQPRAPGQNGEFVRALERARVKVRVAERAVLPGGEGRDLLGWIVQGELDGAVFFSAAQVARLWDAALAAGESGGLPAALGSLTVAASEGAAEALQSRGVQAELVAPHWLHGGATLSDVSALFRGPVEPQQSRAPGRDRVVVVGNGMVGHEFCERLAALDTTRRYDVTVLGEEALPAYDRVHLTSFFETREPRALFLAEEGQYERRGTRLSLGTAVTEIDRKRRLVLTTSGEAVPYDVLVLATGSSPFVPPVPGMEKRGVFVYRTIADLQAILAYAVGAKSAAVIGGGLLGLEAAKATADLGLETHVVEFAPRLMPRQLDPGGGKVLLQKITALGVTVHLGKTTASVSGEERATGLCFADGSRLEVDLVIVSAGIRPRDELARGARLGVGDRGGIVVDDDLRTSDPSVYAIGECALHRGSAYGLVGPGWEMARTLAARLTGGDAHFTGADTSTKLKLLGIDVASVGDPFADTDTGRAIVFTDFVRGVYKKMVLSGDGTRLLGAVLVGDAAPYATLLHATKTAGPLPSAPEELLIGARSGAAAGTELPDSAQICSCNAVTKESICSAIREQGALSLQDIKKCTRATAGCGGCAPIVTEILHAELRAAGKASKARLCEHFAFTRAELFEIAKVKGLRTFEALIGTQGAGHGCEICKPAVASILASAHNEPVLDHDTLQDTNDRFLANIQRGGLYSVVPRIPGGEITPEKLIKLGVVAKRYGLYTKITGGQRIDLFGARLNDLPDIWEELVLAGFESGHAYGKAVRTVKSCVGSTWCRYGVQDAVGFAIRVEERYKGIRAPHKLKSAVSGCIRECAEAQSKDFGLIATEKGWNVYVCGNGGAKPRHADLLASDLDEQTVFRYLDRFLMFYIRTADRLTRTSVWLEKLEGGLEHLRDVVVRDKLGLAATLEADMQRLVDTYQCEWTLVVKDAVRREKFRQFAGTDQKEERVDLVAERGQVRPKDWERDSEPPPPRSAAVERSWVPVARAEDFPKDGGVAIQHGKLQVAVFNFSSRGEWYAVQNRCPHTGDPVLARGIIGDEKGTPKVACPLHKRTFALDDGHCLSGDAAAIETFAVRVTNGWVHVELPEIEHEQLILPNRLVRRAGEATASVSGS